MRKNLAAVFLISHCVKSFVLIPLVAKKTAEVSFHKFDFKSASSDTLTAGQNDITGLHGTGSNFLPVVQIHRDEHYPRTICVAGVYPGITAQELREPVSSEAGEIGSWQYDFSDITEAEKSHTGTVAIPGSDIVTDLIDPVIVVAESDTLGLTLPENTVAEVLVVIDREVTEFEPGKFFIWKKPNDELHIRWFENVPDTYECLGKVMMVHVPYIQKSGGSSGWMEEEDEYY